MIKRALFTSTLVACSSPLLALEQWSGSYLGLNAGMGFNPADNGELEFRRVDGSDNSQAIENAFGDNFDGKFNSGALLGIQAGFNHQSGALVYGVELSVAAADLSQEQTAFSATPASYIERREIDTLATLTGRFGWASGHSFLPYLKVGAAYGDVSYSWEGNSGAFQGDNGKDGDGLGYIAGLGIEFKLDKALSLAFEYQYIDLGDADFASNFSGEMSVTGSNGAFNAFGDSASGGTDAQGSDEDFDFQSIRAQLRYYF